MFKKHNDQLKNEKILILYFLTFPWTSITSLTSVIYIYLLNIVYRIRQKMYTH